MANMRAARRPTIVLNSKLHDRIGFALRKYVVDVGSSRGRVQQKTTQFLEILHEDLIGEKDRIPEWKVCQGETFVCKSAACAGIPRQPPGLEPEAVSDFQCQAVADEACVLTPRPSKGVHRASSRTPVKTRAETANASKKVAPAVLITESMSACAFSVSYATPYPCSTTERKVEDSKEVGEGGSLDQGRRLDMARARRLYAEPGGDDRLPYSHDDCGGRERADRPVGCSRRRERLVGASVQRFVVVLQVGFRAHQEFRRGIGVPRGG